MTRLSDSSELDYELNLDAAPGEHTIAVRVEDEYGNQAAEKTVVRQGWAGTWKSRNIGTVISTSWSRSCPKALGY